MKQMSNIEFGLKLISTGSIILGIVLYNSTYVETIIKSILLMLFMYLIIDLEKNAMLLRGELKASLTNRVTGEKTK